jgi:hypothetical protein
LADLAHRDRRKRGAIEDQTAIGLPQLALEADTPSGEVGDQVLFLDAADPLRGLAGAVRLPSRSTRVI